jgi:hypothetical protein
MALIVLSVLALRVESRVALGDRGLKNGHLLWRRNLGLFTVLADLDEGGHVLGTELSGVVRDAIRCGGRDHLSLGLITSSLVRAAGNGVLVVVRNGVGLFTDASGRRRAVHGTIGASASLSLAVDADGAVGASADGEVCGISVNLERVEALAALKAEALGLSERRLVVVERLTLHDNVLAEVLIAVHASGEHDPSSTGQVVTHSMSLICTL